MNMKAVIFLCISFAVCTQSHYVRTVRKASTTATSPDSTSSTTPTPTPSTTTPTTTTLAKETSSSNENSTSDVKSTSEHPALTVEEYNDHILESAKQGLAAFTLEFQKCAFNVTGTSKNILFSPVNVAGILATLLLGAEGDTKAEILKAVGISTGKDLSQKENQIHLALGKLFENFTAEAHANPATTVEIAQSIFLQSGTQLTDFFKNFSQTVYKNEIIEVDYSSPNVEAADIINKKPFQAESGNYSVKMMANVGEAYLLRELGRNYSALGLPYKGGNIIMYFIVPKKEHTLKEILHDLTIEDLNDITTKSVKVEDISYEVPFLSINDQIQLNGILETIGIKSVFSATHANLSNIADNVFVSQIIHKANLEVTEAGSTGSASTIAQIETKFPKEPFFVNQPFICYVYHRSSSLISFWATVNTPVPNKLS